MKTKRTHSFSNRLTAYILSVCSGVFIIIFFLLYVLPRISQYDNTVANSEVQAERIIETFETQRRTAERISTIITSIPQKEKLIAGDSTFFHDILTYNPELYGCGIEYAPAVHSYDIYFYRNQGRIYHNKPAHTSHSFSEERLVPEAREHFEAHWSSYYYSFNYIHQRIFSRFTPLYDKHNRFIGFLRLDIALRTFTRYVDNLHFHKTGYAYLLSRDGVLLEHPNPELRPYDNRIKKAEQGNAQYINFIKEGMEQGKAAGEITIENENFFLYVQKIPQSDLMLVQISPFVEIYGAVAKASNRMLIFCLICLVILFWAITHIIKRVLKPIQQFSSIARTIADGSFNVPIPVAKNNDEIKELSDSFMYMQQKITDSMDYLKETTREKEKIETEIRLAQRIQERFLPVENKLHQDDVSLYAILEQSKVVGGDIYNYFIKQGRLYFAVGDVRGSGVPAALYMASISTLLNYVAATPSSAEVCIILNEYLCNNADDDMFITMFIGILDLNSGILNYSNAGHPYPILRDSDNNTRFLGEIIDIPLGVMGGTQYKESQIQLKQGDILLLYTDGVTEAENEQNQFYGKEQLLQLVGKVETSTPEGLVDSVLTDLVAYIGEKGDSDDLTLLGIKYHPISDAHP